MEASASLLTDIAEQKGIAVSRASHRGEEIPVQWEGGQQCSAASRFMQGWGETAAAAVSAPATCEPGAAAGQPLLAGNTGR